MMSRQDKKKIVQIISDFLALGHVENIIAMFKQDTSHYALTGMIIQDERFMVRIGAAVLFEELKIVRPDEIKLATPSLLPMLRNPTPFVRGEAVNLLGIIGTDDALAAVTQLRHDPDTQVREIVSDILAEAT